MPGTTLEQKPQNLPEFQYLDTLTELLDSRFCIPGTQIRFGVDFLIGLIPGAGDTLTFIFSGALVTAMARHGVSRMVVLKMLWNILLDTVVGAIPLLGDLFDLQYKANCRNYKLLKEHYHEGKHSGSIWPIVVTVLLVLLTMLAFVIFASLKLLQWVFS